VYPIRSEGEDLLPFSKTIGDADEFAALFAEVYASGSKQSQEAVSLQRCMEASLRTRALAQEIISIDRANAHPAYPR